jgi:hypothetical protein
LGSGVQGVIPRPFGGFDYEFLHIVFICLLLPFG